jgi:hypothetical protein
MFGNLGIGELIITLFVLVPLLCLPIAFVIWFVRKLTQSSRKQDEILARLVALEEKRANR